jgi:hypothetical protein
MSKKKVRLENTPIIIGDRAMELHKLQPANSENNDVLFLLVSNTDYNTLLESYGGREEKKAWYSRIQDEKGIYYYSSWYSLTYDQLSLSAVKIKNKLVVDKQHLLMMSLLPAFDQKNKNPRNLAKKYLLDTTTIANTYIV